MVTTPGIETVAREGIALVEDRRLQAALEGAYRSDNGIRAVETAERVLKKLTSARWPSEVLHRFLSGWGATHGTVAFVSGLMIRAQREARALSEPGRSLLYGASAEIGEIIPDDVGLHGPPHSELFVNFANAVAGDDTWQLSRYAVPACQEFRRFVQERRLAGPLQDGILTTAASENWNTGEYTYFNSIACKWMTDVLSYSAEKAENACAYVSIHAGETELGHFRHALKAWELHCEATGQIADPARARNAFDTYLTRIGTAFAALGRLFDSW